MSNKETTERYKRLEARFGVGPLAVFLANLRAQGRLQKYTTALW